ncbi:MAG: FAD-dependent oxidoreductase [Phycisphaerales bacterium]|nr:FAD-dependent oxidoreductase [Phycisphaerales bacterium]
MFEHGSSTTTAGRTAARPAGRDGVLVVGGGIAGIAAALRLAEAGVPVTLLETRKKLGGRATSFKDVRSGQVIDNCQHVALGCCTNYLDLCRRLTVAHKIEWQREIYWFECGGRVSVMRAGGLPAPGHFSGAFLSASFLTVGEKLAVARGMLAILTADRDAERGRTFAEWLAAHGQPASAVEKFWTPVVVSACNLEPTRVSASPALHVFQEGFLAHRDAALMGVSRVPLVELYDPAEAAIVAAGGSIRLGVGVERLDAREVLTTDGERLRASAVICAVPVERASRLASEEARRSDARFAAMERITHSPILGVHLLFDRPVMRTPNAVLVSRPTQWLFRKDAEGRAVHAVISAADQWVPLDEAEITRRVRDDIVACMPWAADAAVLGSRPVKEKFATFAATPEVEAIRPSTVGASGIVLAGDYTRTGWPATMEGAARSGYAAAAAVLGKPESELLLPPLPPSPLVRILGGPAFEAQPA